jgi:hypothetical protein
MPADQWEANGPLRIKKAKELLKRGISSAFA